VRQTSNRGINMLGAITRYDILSHPIITINCFGWNVFFRAVFSNQCDTFLSLLQNSKTFDSGTLHFPHMELIGRGIKLELKAKHIYEDFADKFSSSPDAVKFFKELAQQEQEHADCLRICRDATQPTDWNEEYLNSWMEILTTLEDGMAEAVQFAEKISSLDEAMQLVLQIESSEVNQLFQAIFMASDSLFVRKILNFKKATEDHIVYITEYLPLISPNFLQASNDFYWKFMN